MDELVKEFSFWGTMALAVMCYVATFFTRSILTTAMPWLEPVKKDGKESYTCGWARWYNKVFLYAIPVTFGLAFAFIPSKFLFGGIDTIGGKMFWGGMLGWFSALIYKGVKYEPKEVKEEGSKEV